MTSSVSPLASSDATGFPFFFGGCTETAEELADFNNGFGRAGVEDRCEDVAESGVSGVAGTLVTEPERGRGGGGA